MKMYVDHYSYTTCIQCNRSLIRYIVHGTPYILVHYRASKYGETAEECGDAYYQYGCSLLELASMENGVLGNALQGVPDESADSADSDDEEGEQKPGGSNVESADKLEGKVNPLTCNLCERGKLPI